MSKVDFSDIYDVLSNDVYWVTRNKDIIKVGDMDDKHLINSMKVLESICESAKIKLEIELEVASCSVSGEYAILDIESKLSSLSNLTGEDWLYSQPLFIRMMEECDKRGIDYFEQ